MATKKKTPTKKTTTKAKKSSARGKKIKKKNPLKISPSKGYIQVGYINEALSEKWNIKKGPIFANIDNLVIHIKTRHPEIAINEPDLYGFVKNSLLNHDEMAKAPRGGVSLIYRGTEHSPYSIANYNLKFNSKNGLWIVSTIYIKSNSKLPKKTEKVRRKKKNR